MSKKTLSLEDIESTMALDLPDRELMSWASIASLHGIEVVHVTFNNEVEGNNFCVQWMSQQYDSSAQCMVMQED